MNPTPARVLLVDDDPEDQMIVRRFLRKVRGFECELDVASSFDEALTVIDRGEHDLFLFDYFLGAHTGLELIQRVRRRDPDAPVILLTGLDQPEGDLEALRLGASDYLEKHRLSTSALQRAILHARERALAVRALRASEERYALALEGSNDGIWDWDLQRDEVHFSPRWWALVGVEDPPPAPSRMEVWTERVHPSDREEVRRALAEHVEGLVGHFECEFRMRHENGSHLWMLARGVGVRGADGTVRRMAGSLTDVTERRSAQERLISHVSHELRTPLTAIYQFVTNLRDGIAGNVNTLQAELLGASVRNVEELDRMVTGLVEATRARSDAFSLARQAVSPAELVREVHASHARIAAKSGVALRHELPEGLPDAYADPSRLRQVLVNLVGNAIKYTPPGGSIVMRASVDPADPRLLLFEVVDDGPGIAIAHQRRIFERLVQLEDATERARKGLGLGLYICKEIVSHHQGRIWVRSRLGEGSTFCFTIPVFDLAVLFAPTLDEARRREQQLLLVDIVLTPPPGNRAGITDPVELRQLRSIAERSLGAMVGLVLPRPSSRGPGDGILLVAATGTDEGEELVRRVRSQLADTFDPALERFVWSVDRVDATRLQGSSNETLVAEVVAQVSPEPELVS